MGTSKIKASSAKGNNSVLSFVLDGELIRPEQIEPTRTLLDYLREDLQRTGTKEGCAEGDCGACTVVIGSLGDDGKSTELHTANACIQCLPTLDGKQLFTVESLTSDPRQLHPVQKALVENHASQCGFCTPGFVMSLFWLFKNQKITSYNELNEVLSGNICRCTGYRPILDAGVQMYDSQFKSPDTQWINTPGPTKKQGTKTLDLLNQANSAKTLSLKHPENGRLGYVAPHSLKQLAELYLKYPDAQLLAGGTDIGIWVTKAFRKFSMLLYTGKVKQLLKIGGNKKQLEIGAAVSLTRALPPLLDQYPEFKDYFLRFASLPIRNLATLGGNICNASPIGDSMPVLLCLGARLKLRKGKTSRELPLNKFYLDYQKTAMQRGELLESILIPKRKGNMQIASYKVSKRFDQDISAVSAAFCLLAADKQMNTPPEFRLAFGGVAAIPKRATKVENYLNRRIQTDGIIDATDIAKARKLLGEEFTPLSDMRASAEYRSLICANLLQRFLEEVSGQSAAAQLTVRDYQHGS